MYTMTKIKQNVEGILAEDHLAICKGVGGGCGFVVRLIILRLIKTVQLFLTTVACDFWSTHCSRHAKHRTQLLSLNIAYTYDCRRIFKCFKILRHFFCDVHESGKQVVGLIYTKQFVS